MPRRSLTGYTVAFALIVAVLVAGRRPLASSIERARAEDSELDRAPSRVGFYRYRARRDTVAAMRAYLLKVVAAESAFVAESGRVRNYALIETTKGVGSTASVHVEWPFAPPFIWCGAAECRLPHHVLGVRRPRHDDES